MIVSKFGGTSVGSSKNIKRVIQIIANKNNKTVVVVSAIGGITNLLIKASELAVQGDNKYNSILNEIKEKHIDIIEELFEKTNQIQCKKFVISHLKKLK